MRFGGKTGICRHMGSRAALLPWNWRGGGAGAAHSGPKSGLPNHMS